MKTHIVNQSKAAKFLLMCCLLVTLGSVLADSESVDPCEQAKCLYGQADTDYHAGFYGASLRTLLQVLETYTECQLPNRDLAGVHRSIARSLAALDSLEKSINHLDQALSLYRGCKDERFFVAETHRERGAVYYRFGRYERSLAEESTAIEYHRAHGSARAYIARCYEIKGRAFFGLGRYEKAIASYDSARVIYAELKRPDIYESNVCIGFELSSVPRRSRIVSANLYLYYYEWHDNDPAFRGLTLYRITEGWKEPTVNYATEPMTELDPTDRSFVPADPGWMRWEVTADVQSYVDGRGGDYGWKITDENRWMAYNIPQVLFYSRENRESGRTPYLEIEYSNAQSPETFFPPGRIVLDPVADATTYMPTPTATHGSGTYVVVRNRYGALAMKAQVARCHMGNGRALHSLGEYEEAKHQYLKALELLEEIRKGSEKDRAHCYSSIGSVFIDIGEYEESVEKLRSALAIYGQVLRAQREQGDCYQSLGDALRALGDYERCVDHYRLALNLYEELEGTERTRGVCYQKIGLVQLDAGRPKKALNSFRRALDIFSGLSGATVEQGDCHRMIGDAYFAMGKKKNGYASLRMAVAFYGDSEGTDGKLAQCYLALALAYKDSDKEEAFIRAAEDFAAAVFYTERHRDRGWAMETRMDLFSATSEVYPALVFFLLKYGNRGWWPQEEAFTRWMSSRDPHDGAVEAAFHFAEAGKSRALVEILPLKITEVSDPGLRSLLRRTRAVQAEILAIDSRLRRMDEDDDARREAERTFQEKKTERRQLESELKQTTIGKYRSPRFRTAEEMRTGLKEDEAIIEYVVGDDETILFALTRSWIRHWTISIGRGLPSDLTTATEKLDWELEERFWFDPASVGLEGLVRLFRNWMLNLGSDLEGERIDRVCHIEAGRFLCSLLLPEEVREAFRTAGIERLLVVPDDFLHLLPLEALVTSRKSGVARPNYCHCEFLLEEYSFSYTSSIALLDAIRERHGERGGQATRDFLGMAEAIVSGDDERLPAPSAGTRNAGFGFRRIPGTCEEARRCGAVFGDVMVFHTRPSEEEIASLNSCVFCGVAASKELLKKLPLKDYRHLFFASHAYPNVRNPMLSAIVLTGPIDANPYEPALLTAMDVHGLELNADLVTLAACETAVGPCVRGEGMVGLVTSFFDAGASSVAATLWPVATNETAQLMEDFYTHLSEEESKAEALRSTKLKMMQDSPDPSFWAGFVLYGQP